MNLFESQLALVQEPDGEYTVYSLTLAPNSCYRAGSPKKGAPGGVVTTPETLVYQFPLIHSSTGVCLQMITSVHHEVQNLRFDTGHSRLLVFAMLDDKIVGRASISPNDHARVTVLTAEAAATHAKGTRVAAAGSGGGALLAVAAGADRVTTRPDLTADLCLEICADSTPDHPTAVDPEAQLMKLGVVNGNTASVYRAGVQARLNEKGWQISRSNIAATPQTTLDASAESVQSHAF